MRDLPQSTIEAMCDTYYAVQLGVPGIPYERAKAMLQAALDEGGVVLVSEHTEFVAASDRQIGQLALALETFRDAARAMVDELEHETIPGRLAVPYARLRALAK